MHIQESLKSLCLDYKPRQNFHLKQIPFDVEIDLKTKYALTYQILIQFEKTIKEVHK